MNRLLDQIIRGNYRIDLPQGTFTNGYTPEKLRASLAHASRLAVAVDATNVFEWCLHKDDTNKLGELYSLVPHRLPFEMMWLEGRLMQVCEDDPENPHLFPAQLGMLLIEIWRDDLRQGHANYVFHFVRLMTETPFLFGAFYMEPAPEGEMIDSVYALGQWNFANETERQDYEAKMADCLHFTLSTLIFFACKNVSLRKIESRAKQSEKSIRKSGNPLPDFHVINIHHNEHPSPAGERRQQQPRDLAEAHIVRGHFKHYSAGAPLMGKHAGTYFWHAQVRGEGNLSTRYRIWSPSPEHAGHCLVNQQK